MSTWLETLRLPEDLKTLNSKQMAELAEEIRARLIAVVSETGGHLASNLGVVELTLGLYSVFDPYQDKIIWDVGHQSYVHKILTGRNAALPTLRSFGGLSGFPKREESPADCFNTGHSSTSLSAGLGMVRARSIRGESYHVISVIGDGALTGGMAFEALNDAARTFGEFLIILNDNGMSISRNVGGMSQYLGRIRTRRSYIRLKRGVKLFLSKIPLVGERLIRGIKRFKASLKLLLIPGELFEDLGLPYIGPVDGHDVKAVQNALRKAMEQGGPVLVHMITRKGYGYPPAEENPDLFHGVPSFDPDSGQLTSDQAVSFSRHFAEHLIALAEQDVLIAAVTAAMPTGTGLQWFGEKFPERFVDVGIAEQHAVTMAAGMAASGIKPFVVIYSTFLQRAYDQLLHDVALQQLPVIIGIDRAGVSGADGETHQGIYDLAYLNPMPYVSICAPCCVEEQAQMMDVGLSMFFASSDQPHPVPRGPFVIRYPAKDRFTRDRSFVRTSPVVYGKGVLLRDEPGQADVTLAALGSMVEPALEAAELLEKEGIRTLVFHPRFVQPLDGEGLRACVERTRCLVTVEDGVVVGGYGSYAADYLMSYGGLVPMAILGFPDEPVEHGSIDQLYHKYCLDAVGIASRVRSLLAACRKGA